MREIAVELYMQDNACHFVSTDQLKDFLNCWNLLGVAVMELWEMLIVRTSGKVTF